MSMLRLFGSAIAFATVALAFPNPDGTCLITTGVTLPAGTVNVGLNIPIQVESCDLPLRFSVDGGSLPPGMTLSPTTGILAGQPTTAGLYAFTVRVGDGLFFSPTKTFALRINSALQIDRRILASAGASSTSYADRVSVSGGLAPYTFALTGSLPPGLTLNPTTGEITGIIGAGFTAPADFSIQVTDSSSPANTVRSAFQIVPNATRSISTLTLPNGTQGVAYNSTVTLGTGTGGSFLLASGALPTGLSLNPSTGVLSGTPSASGSFWFTIQSRLITGGSVSSAWRTYNVLISNLSGLQFTTGATPPGAEIRTAYRGLLSPIGGVAPFTYSLSSGSLPPGVLLDTATGLLHGDVTTTLTPSFNATIQVTDARGATASQAFTFNMVAVFTQGAEYGIPVGVVGSAYSTSAPPLAGGTTPVTFELDPWDGPLPPGLLLNPATGVITGTPTEAGSYSFTLIARDPLGGYRAFLLSTTIQPALTMTTASPLPDYAASGGGLYFADVFASGGTGTISYSVTGGALPSGINLLGIYGFLSGSSTAIGTYSFTIQATDDGGRTASRTYTMSVVPTVAVATGSLPSGFVGQTYSSEITAQGAPNTFEYLVDSGTLPPGVSLGLLTGVLSGTPTTVGVYNFGIRIRRADGLGTPNVRAFQIRISNPLQFTTTSPLPRGGVGNPYSVTLQATGGRAPYRFVAGDSSFPSGLFLNNATGVVSGVPLASGSQTTSVQVRDADGFEQLREFSFTIGLGVQFTTSWLPNGTRTVPYSQTVAATGGSGTFTYSLATGTLPTGVTLTPSTGALAGTPSAAGTFNFTLRATDSFGIEATQAFTVVIAEPLTFVTASPIPNAALNAAYAQTFSVSGGRSPVQYSVVSNAPPAILGMTPATGSFNGFPIVSGTYTMTVRAQDADGRSVQSAFQHTVGGPPVLSGSLPAGTVGQVYSQSIPVTGGLAPYVFSLLDSSLPPGLSLNASTGLISGTPTLAGTTNLTVLVVDATGLENIQSYTLQIYSPLVVTPSTLPNGTAGSPYSAGVSASGAVGSATFAVTGGSLPPGVLLNPTSGALTGTPTAANSYTFTITATDGVPRTASATYTVTIASGFAISTAVLPTGIVGTPYSATIVAQGNLGAVTFAVTTGSLPAGLVLDSTSGIISGIPTGAGSTFTITATDPPSTTAQRSFTITILPRFSITTLTLPNGAVGTPYSATIQTQNAQGTVTFEVASGSLPPGLSLNPNTGVISGNPTLNGSRTFTIRATDALLTADYTGPRIRNVDQIAEQTYTITIGAAMSFTTAATLPNGNVTTPYSVTLQTQNGNPPVSFAITAGALPPGLTLNTSTGVISGTPTAAANSSFTVRATDTTERTASRAFTIAISGPFSFSTSTLPNGALGVPYNATLQTQNSQAQVTFLIVQGQLPPGLNLNGNTGVISGTPTQNGSSTFTVQATDSSSSSFADARKQPRAVDQIAEQAFTITIGGALAITTTSLPNGTVTTPYTTTIEVANSAGAPVFALTAGTLPGGLTLSASGGVISGTPSASGTFPITITATDQESRTSVRDFSNHDPAAVRHYHHQPSQRYRWRSVRRLDSNPGRGRHGRL
jgi:hypothetical protein